MLERIFEKMDIILKFVIAYAGALKDLIKKKLMYIRLHFLPGIIKKYEENKVES